MFHTPFHRRQLHTVTVALLAAWCLLLGGCASNDGGYYGGDAPPKKWRLKNVDKIADAVPRIEPLSKTGNHPYTALGKRYVPMSRRAARGYRKRGTASWYGKKFHGRRTSSGDKYDMYAMTAAHPRLPLPSYVRVTNLDNGKKVVVRVNDRGPFLHGRVIDLSYAAAYKLGIAQRGTGRVEVRLLNPSKSKRSSSNNKSQSKLKASAVSTVASSADGKFFVQVGAYQSLINAKAMQIKLKNAGFAALPLRKSGKLYKVLSGPYASHRKANKARKQFEKKFDQRAAVVGG